MECRSITFAVWFLIVIRTTSSRTGESSHSSGVTIFFAGIIVAAVAVFATVIACCCMCIRKGRRQRQPNRFSERDRTNINQTSNRGVAAGIVSQNQSNLGPSIPQFNTVEDPYIRTPPPFGELSIQIPKPPEYSSIAELETNKDPPPYEPPSYEQVVTDASNIRL